MVAINVTKMQVRSTTYLLPSGRQIQRDLCLARSKLESHWITKIDLYCVRRARAWGVISRS